MATSQPATKAAVGSPSASSPPTLRPYQQESVRRVIEHFRATHNPAVVVLPTGSGKSLVIAELARLARGRELVLAHVRELVEQNHEIGRASCRERGERQE